MAHQLSTSWRLLALWLGLVTLNTHAETTRSLEADTSRQIKVESEEWANATEADGHGLYWDILRAVFEPKGFEIHTNTSTYKRSVGLLQTGEVDIMVGAYSNEVAGGLYPRWHFDADDVVALTRADNPSRWNGEENLRDKHIAYVRGYALRDYLNVPVIQHEYYQRAQIFELIDDQKVDYYVDARADILAAMKSLNLDPANYKINTVKPLKLYFVFTDSQKGETLKTIFDQRFATLLEDGTVQQLHQKWHWPVNAFN
ncbi:MAG: transporter substrate-binding domain-containing protein [Pseudomonadales bacterium]|nr:transporter substrate-binding domain-containing protein [Pseudomonadales bacterium]